MLTAEKHVVALYADRTSRQWIVRDPDGKLWHLPTTETPWDDREPYCAADEADLEPIPGHYLNLFGLPHLMHRARL